MFSIWSEQINGVNLPKANGIEVAAHRFLVGEHNNNFLVRRGWGAIFQNSENPNRGWVEFANRQNVCYVKLVFLSTYCFH